VSSLAPISAAPVTAGRVGPDSPTGAPVVDEAHAPASVRSGSAAVKAAYASAQGFEEMLLQQLSSSLVQSSGLSGEGESGEEGSSEAGGEAGSSMLSSLLPQTLTEGVMREGGLGLAGQLMGSLDPSASTAAAGRAGSVSFDTSGGVSAPTAAAASNAAAAHSGGASA
jgi:Rod binding domain-containing protein